MRTIDRCPPTSRARIHLGCKRVAQVPLVILLAAAPLLGIGATSAAHTLSPQIAAADPATQLAVSSAPFSTPASTLSTNPFTVTLEDASGNPVTRSTALRIFLSGSSTGRRFSATSGGASEATATLPAGSSSVTVYYGDTKVGSPTITVSVTSPPSNSVLEEGSQTETVTAALTATSLSANPTPGTFGVLDTLTSTTTSTDGIANGRVTFSAGSTRLCTSVATTNGVAICSVSTLQAATYSLTAAFITTSPTFTGSTSSPISLTVNPAATTTTLLAPTGPVSFGDSVTLTADVSSAGGTPSGTVTFFDGVIPVCTAVALSSGSATCMTSGLPVASDSLSATMTSTSVDFTGSTSNAVSLTVNPAATVTTLLAPTGPVIYGTQVTLTANVSSSNGTPTGSVTFFNGVSDICDSVLLSAGSASCTTSTLPVGTDSLTAVTTTDTADLAGSTSSAVNLTVNAGPGTQLVITSAPFSAPTSITAVDPVTITLEDAYGNPTAATSNIRVDLAGSSPGKMFSATPGGTNTTFITLPTGSTSVTLYYGDTVIGTPSIIASLTSPPSNAHLLMGTQIETIT